MNGGLGQTCHQSEQKCSQIQDKWAKNGTAQLKKSISSVVIKVTDADIDSILLITYFDLLNYYLNK